MGVNTLNTRSAGETITADYFNDFNSALNGDMVGRSTSGVATSGQNLGTTAIPWGTVRANTMVIGGTTIDTSQIARSQNTVTSGKVRSTSNQPAFITPNGAALSAVINGATTSLVLDINGTAVTVSSNLSLTSLTAAASSQNTCLVDDTAAADQHDTRLWGTPEHRKAITIDTIGTNISALNGKFAAFMLDNGSSTEYFTAFVDTSNNRLIKCRRGYFYDSSLNPKNRIVFSNNDTITLLKWGFVFVEDDGVTTSVSYTVPVWAVTAPSSPATNDYWYDLANNTWKRYDGASWAIIDRTLVGSFVNSSTACVGARCEPFYANYKPENDLALEVSTTEIVRSVREYGRISVAGNLIEFHNTLPSWNITTDLDGTDYYDATEQASRMYYLYIKDTGALVMTDIHPMYANEFYGWYHPHNPWRCVGVAYNNGSSNITVAGDLSSDNDDVWVYTTNGYGSLPTVIRRWTTEGRNQGGAIIYVDDSTNGGTFTCFWPCQSNVHFIEQFNTGQDFGLSLNSTQLNTNIASITATDRIANCQTAGANIPNEVSTSLDLKIGDVVRAHTAGTTSGSATYAPMMRLTSIKKK